MKYYVTSNGRYAVGNYMRHFTNNRDAAYCFGNDLDWAKRHAETYARDPEHKDARVVGFLDD